MRKKQQNVTTIRLESTDREAIARIRELYGCPSDSGAIKLAVRMVARGEASSAYRQAAIHPQGFRQGHSGRYMVETYQHNRYPDERGHFGIFGGKFVPESLMAALSELETAYQEARNDP